MDRSAAGAAQEAGAVDAEALLAGEGQVPAEALLAGEGRVEASGKEPQRSPRAA